MQIKHALKVNLQTVTKLSKINEMKCHPLSCYCCGKTVQQRHVLYLLICVGVIVAYGQRFGFNVALTSMTHPLVPTQGSEAANKSLVGSENGGSKCVSIYSEEADDGNFEWVEVQQGNLLGSFYIGFALGHMPTRILLNLLRPKWVLILTVAANAACMAITPYLTEIGGLWMLWCLRVTMGLFQGLLFETLTAILSAWIPSNERALMGVMLYTSAQVGIALSFVKTGLIVMFAGWKVYFYAWAGVAAGWCVLFAIFCNSKPSRHKYITRKELEKLESSVNEVIMGHVIPWTSILKSPAVWAIVFGQIAHLWTFLTITVMGPKYFTDVLGENVFDMSWMLTLPFAILWTWGWISSWIVHKTIEWGKMSLLNVRRVCGCFSGMLPAVFLVLVGIMGCNKWLALTMFGLSLGSMAPYYAGIRANTLDLTLYHTTSIMALSNAIGTMTFAPMPLYFGHLTKNQTVKEWQTCFYIILGVAIVSTVAYMVLAKTEREDWDIMQDS